MTTHTLILGAGMVGVSIAWHLRARGREVTLVDRRDPGRETSYGNAGLIQREAVQPHPFPHDLGEILRVLPNRSTDIRYRAGAMLSEAHPLWQYWRHSAPKSFAQIVPEYASLIEHCTADHEVMFQAAGAEHLIRRDGWLQLYRSNTAFEESLAEAADFRERFGVTFERVDNEHLHRMEPYLSARIIGAIHWTNSWAVSDPGALVRAYAADLVARGGKIQQAEAETVEQAEAGWRMRTDKGILAADELVLATGPWSPAWLEQLGYQMPMFVMRGYHMHYDAVGEATLNYPIMDFEKGYLITPKQAGLRLTTGAELNLLDAPPRFGQLNDAEKIAREIFPLGQRREAEPWIGSRPCMADMKPVIGPGHRHNNLWFAFGHGHLGFTLGPTTGRLLGQLMDGETPAVDMAPFAGSRF